MQGQNWTHSDAPLAPSPPAVLRRSDEKKAIKMNVHSIAPLLPPMTHLLLELLGLELVVLF